MSKKVEKTGVLVNVKEIIYKTLIEGDSYKTLLKGLGVTLQISILSVVLGTLMGMVVCMMKRCRFKPLARIATFYIAILRGSPVLLLLMLMYYVVFAGSDVSASVVAVAAYTDRSYMPTCDWMDRALKSR